MVVRLTIIVARVQLVGRHTAPKIHSWGSTSPVHVEGIRCAEIPRSLQILRQSFSIYVVEQGKPVPPAPLYQARLQGFACGVLFSPAILTTAPDFFVVSILLIGM